MLKRLNKNLLHTVEILKTSFQFESRLSNLVTTAKGPRNRDTLEKIFRDQLYCLGSRQGNEEEEDIYFKFPSFSLKKYQSTDITTKEILV